MVRTTRVSSNAIARARSAVRAACLVVVAAGPFACSSSSATNGGSVDGGAVDLAFDASYDGAGLACGDAGSLAAMAADPDAGPVDVAVYCLTLINGYRAKAGLAPYWLHDTSSAAMCCAAQEAEQAATTQGHANGGCGWTSQGFCGGGRNPDGTVKASMDWCPKLFYQEGPTGGHYQAMMRPEPRGIMCSFYALSRDSHAIVVDYY
jgi:hypothetical protein